MNEMQQKINIIIVDDHKLFRAGLMALLNTAKYINSGVHVVAEVEDGVSAIQECIKWRPDIVLLDVDIPTLDGVTVAQELSYHVPDTNVIALSSDTSTQTVVQMVRNGARGFVSKDTDVSELLQSIIDVHQGLTYFSQEASTSMVESLTGKGSKKQSKDIEPLAPDELLTKREREILKLVSEEKSNNEIANLLFISSRTVETHKRNILHKLKVKNVAGLVKYYLHHTAQFAQ